MSISFICGSALEWLQVDFHELYKQQKVGSYALQHCFTQSKYRDIQLPNFLF